jgi:hypothetical protein
VYALSEIVFLRQRALQVALKREKTEFAEALVEAWFQ